MTDHRDSKPEETPEPQQLGAPEATPGNPQRPEPSTEPSQDQRQVLIDADLKSARTLSTVAAIAGPVSFIIGGVMLSTVGLVCAIVGFVKIKHVIDDVDGRQKVYAPRYVKRLSGVSPSAPLRSSSTSSASRS